MMAWIKEEVLRPVEIPWKLMRDAMGSSRYG
jgi:hypothetical protein